MTNRMVRVFVNGTGVDVPAGATALDAVRAWRESEADAVRAGTRVITDSRGLASPPDATVEAGSIFRLVSSRARGETDDATADHA